MKKFWLWVVAILLIPLGVLGMGAIAVALVALVYYVTNGLGAMVGVIPPWLGWGLTLLLLLITIKISGIPEAILRRFSKKKK